VDFELDDHERRIQQCAREAAGRLLAPRAAARDLDSSFPAAELRELATRGLLGIQIAPALGGAGASAVAYAAALMELGAACAATAVPVAVTNMAAELVERFGTPTQAQRWVPPLVRGELLCAAFALSEPGAGSDPSSIATTAQRTADGWRLRGTKQWISHGDQAGLIVVWARTRPDPGAKALSAFLVDPRRTAGTLTVGRREDKMGLRGSSTVTLLLDEVEVPNDALLGAEGDGLRLALTALDGGRIGIASQAVGIAQAAQRLVVDHLRRREGAASLGQTEQFALADSAVAIEAARLLTWTAAYRKRRGQRYTRAAAIAKLVATEEAWRVCDRAIQLHGADGYTRRPGVERLARDVRVGRIYEGTSEIQRLVIARETLRASPEGGAP
jgi:hypothetical protein